MRTFVREGAAYVARLEAPERAVLLDVVDDVVALVGARAAHRTHGSGPDDPLAAVQMATLPLPAPTDPALLRLLPPASPDPEVAAEFRRLTEVDLRRSKSDQLLRLRACVDAAGPDLVVVPSEAPRIAAALTDVRLVTSERLGLRSDAEADALYRLVLGDEDGEGDVSVHGEGLDEEREQAHRLLGTVYVILSVLQESLVGLMLAGLPDDDADDEADDGADPDADGDARDTPGATGATEPPTTPR
ncbi:hypothetical protein N866_18150 [Actinotalea ferrariae CF5-4]|uniref:Uncharacterized protein n=1 Tax=Actinotalea ferrariae CF5-4 TaxID=948458 RepID=A0A021VUT2_9CELL|nr:DUF2017 family protein [Actinotalea ferrariae]EYR63820.1 hypothetical protein N866_18150 [Actinotalea ferrariae CF5-4]